MQPILEVAIGLTLLMVVFSVMVSATIETISMVLRKRAKDLEAGVKRMLSDDAGQSTGGELADAVLDHPLVSALGRKPGRRPAYISSDIFSAATVDRLVAAAGDVADDVDGTITQIDQGIASLPEPLRRRLEAIRRQAGDEVDDFRKAVEVWFDRQMDRVSGWYTRWAQIVMLVVGVAAALLLNVSAVTVARVLWNDPVLRTELVAEAEEAGEEPTGDGSGASTGDDPETGVGTDVELSRFPIGWNDTAWPGKSWYLGLHLLGVLAVGLAASLGAPFWFDLFSRFSNLRSVGPKPEQAKAGDGS
jgi:hypothetical protein